MADNVFTDAQIQEIMKIFTESYNKEHRQYIGARYVPIFGRKNEDTIEWDNKGAYEPLTIVLHEGNSYTSRQFVPVGIDVLNQAYWANTGNYNAQVEQYRQETLKAVEKAESALNVANEAMKDVNAEKVRAEAAEKVNADAISAEKARAEAAEQDNAAAISAEKVRAEAAEQDNAAAISEEKVRAKKETFERSILNADVMHFGSIDLTLEYPNMQNPQGMCIRNDTLVCVSTNSNNSNECIVFDINRKTGAIAKTTTVNWGHANALCYDKDEDCIYVCTNYDFTNNKQQVNSMLKVNANTYTTLETINFNFEPHSMAIDPITKECWITAEEYSPFAIKLYKVDKTNWSTELVGIIDTSLKTVNFVKIDSYGTQNIRAYNGELWYLVGGNSVNALLNLDKKDASIKRIVSNINNSFIYSLQEAECFDFTDEGDVYLWSRSNYHNSMAMGVVSMINIYGGKCVAFPNSQINNTNIYIYLNPKFTGTICKFGNSDNPFTNIYECIQALIYGKGTEIRIVDDYTIPAKDLQTQAPLKISINSEKTLSVQKQINAPYLFIGKYGTGTATLNITEPTYFGGFVNLESITVTGEMLNITRGLLTSTNVKEGKFDGDNHSGLFKSGGSTGAYQRFVVSSSS